VRCINSLIIDKCVQHRDLAVVIAGLLSVRGGTVLPSGMYIGVG
jgi:hypothetical protein